VIELKFRNSVFTANHHLVGVHILIPLISVIGTDPVGVQGPSPPPKKNLVVGVNYGSGPSRKFCWHKFNISKIDTRSSFV